MDRRTVPEETVARLSAMSLALPEAYQEPAWVGTRWRVRQHTFAHVLAVANGNPPAYVRAAGVDDAVTLMTFRSAGAELAALTAAGHPFFRPQWGPNVVGMILDNATDWDEVKELVTESYCLQAPKKLVARVERPADG